MTDLQTLRAKWETADALVGHWRFPHENFHLSILRAGQSFHLIRYFKIGTQWNVSCDLQNEPAEKVFDRLAYLFAGGRED